MVIVLCPWCLLEDTRMPFRIQNTSPKPKWTRTGWASMACLIVLSASQATLVLHRFSQRCPFVVMKSKIWENQVLKTILINRMVFTVKTKLLSVGHRSTLSQHSRWGNRTFHKCDIWWYYEKNGKQEYDQHFTNFYRRSSRIESKISNM